MFVDFTDEVETGRPQSLSFLNINASRLPRCMASGSGVCQRGSVGWLDQGGGRWWWSEGGECYTLAVNVEMGPVLHSHSSQMPLYSVPPSFHPLTPLFPPPINDPFVRVFFAAVGLAGLRAEPQDHEDSLSLLFSPHILPSLISFSPFLPPPFRRLCAFFFVSLFDVLSLASFILHNLCPHPTSRAVGFLKFLPSPLFSVVGHFWHQKKKLLRLYAFHAPLSFALFALSILEHARSDEK